MTSTDTASVDLTPPLADLITRVQSRHAHSKGRIIIGITGSPGAGKSTLAESLVAHLGDIAVWVPMDGFHLANATLDALGRHDRKGAPDTFDAFGYVHALRRVRNETGHPVYLPSFHRERDEPIAAQVVVEPHHRIVITEGNYLLLSEDPWPLAAQACDEVWFCQVEDAERQQRLIQRHHRHGRSLTEARAWADTVDSANAGLVQPTRQRADLIITTGLGASEGPAAG